MSTGSNSDHFLWSLSLTHLLTASVLRHVICDQKWLLTISATYAHVQLGMYKGRLTQEGFKTLQIISKKSPPQAMLKWIQSGWQSDLHLLLFLGGAKWKVTVIYLYLEILYIPAKSTAALAPLWTTEIMCCCAWSLDCVGSMLSCPWSPEGPHWSAGWTVPELLSGL